MKSLGIPALNVRVRFYLPSERERFNKDYETEVLATDHGAQVQNAIWIGDCKNQTAVCYHEAVHLADWILEQRLRLDLSGLEGSSEIRATLSEYLGSQVEKYIKKEKK